MSSTKNQLLTCVLSLFIALPCLGQDSIYFKSVRVFDGAKVLSETNVLIEKGKIASIGKEVQPAGARIIDGSGHTLLPGLIDCHTHAFFAAQLEQAAMFGVTTELDMMSMPLPTRAFRQQQKDGEANDRADLYSAGAAVTVKQGHGTQFGFPVPTLEKAEDAESFVKARIKEGSDYIKIIHEDGSAYGMSLPTLTPEMMKAAIKATRENEKMAVAHIGSQVGAKLAIENGIHGLVHLFAEAKIDSGLVETAKKNKVFVIPTTVVTENVMGASNAEEFMNEDPIASHLTAANKSNLEKSFPKRPGMKATGKNLAHNIMTLHRAGIPILVGTDAPNPGTVHGASMHHELERLVQAGLSPADALAGATSKPAFHFGLKDRGRVAPGLRADLFLVRGDPTRDIKATRAIVGVWKAGHSIDRSQRAKEVRAEMAAAKNAQPADANQMVSNFEDGTKSTTLGHGWGASTDSIMGGTSTVKMEVVSEGANETKSSLKIVGDVRKDQPAFSGIMFSPGSAPMQKHDLSSFSGFTFSAKSTGKAEIPLQLMLFTEKGGFQPAMKPFKATSEWKNHQVKFKELNGSDGSDVVGIWFGSNSSGKFEFLVDEFELTK